MNDSIDLADITDVQQLKVLKCEQYDELMKTQAQERKLITNLDLLTQRIGQLVETPILASSSQMAPVNLDVQTPDNK